MTNNFDKNIIVSLLLCLRYSHITAIIQADRSMQSELRQVGETGKKETPFSITAWWRFKYQLDVSYNRFTQLERRNSTYK